MLKELANRAFRMSSGNGTGCQSTPAKEEGMSLVQWIALAHIVSIVLLTPVAWVCWKADAELQAGQPEADEHGRYGEETGGWFQVR